MGKPPGRVAFLRVSPVGGVGRNGGVRPERGIRQSRPEGRQSASSHERCARVITAGAIPFPDKQRRCNFLCRRWLCQGETCSLRLTTTHSIGPLFVPPISRRTERTGHFTRACVCSGVSTHSDCRRCSLACGPNGGRREIQKRLGCDFRRHCSDVRLLFSAMDFAGTRRSGPFGCRVPIQRREGNLRSVGQKLQAGRSASKLHHF